jgi:hypothetical protein
MTELEAKDREAIALLHETHCGPGSLYGLCWRLRVVDRLSIPQIAQMTGCRPGDVARYLKRVNAQLLAAGHRGPLPAVPALLEALDADANAGEDEASESLRRLAEMLREAYRNRRDDQGGIEWALPPAARLILRDFEDVILRAREM